MPTEIKICGLSDEEGVDAALDAGADFVGFNFFPPSPRHIALDGAVGLAARARGRARVVAVIVDADDALLSAIANALRPDFLQLHGSETPARVTAVRLLTGLPVMKALGISRRSDVAAIDGYGGEADRFLLDAKPPRDASRPGGNATAFDWTLLDGFSCRRPWLLAGGLGAENVAAALAATTAQGVDVSSGVESAPGRKDPALIHAFVRAVRAFDRPSRRMTR